MTMRWSFVRHDMSSRVLGRRPVYPVLPRALVPNRRWTSTTSSSTCFVHPTSSRPVTASTTPASTPLGRKFCYVHYIHGGQRRLASTRTKPQELPPKSPKSPPKSPKSSKSPPKSSTSPPKSPTSPPKSQPAIQLRDYQEDCIQAVLTAIRNGHKRMGISLATGSGKTVIFTQLIPRVPAPNPGATRTLVLAHRRELVEQAANHCTRAHPDATVEVEMANIHASGAADITVASIQSITSRDRLDKYDPSRFKLILVDEAHHIVAPNYLRALEHFGLHKKQEGSPTLVGVSATFGRFDGLALGSAIDEIVFHKDYVDMIGDKWLSDVIFTTVESSVDLSRIKNASNGDFQPGELSKVVNTNEINEITVRTWRAKAFTAGRKSTLIFCVDVAHVIGLTNWFRQRHGIDARFVTGETPKLERGETLAAFREGQFPVLVNCGVFTEGTDIPNIDCVVLARPTRSRNLLVQMIGRGMRLHPEKTNCHIIDMVSSLDTGIVTTPTLFGLDPSEMVSEATVDDLRSTAAERKEKAEYEARKKEVTEQDKLRLAQDNASTFDPTSISNTSVTFTEYASVFDLISDTSGEKHIRAISPHAWVNVSRDKYVLSNSDGSYVRLEKEVDPDMEAPWVGVQVKAIPFYARARSGGIPFASPREIVRATTFSDAVHGCDSFAAENFPRFMIVRGQAWRANPATQGQITFLNKVRKGSGETILTPETLQKGLAMDMITKIRHGAKTRFAQHTALKKRIEKAELKAERDKVKKLNEVVKLGPLNA